jgi:lysophospholipase L1-like esterase
MLGTVEMVAYVLGELYISPRAGFILYRRPDSGAVSKAAFEDYMRIRHPLLGWPSPSEFGGERFDPSGSRWIPSFPEEGTETISLYGDSFTYGSEVSHEDAWSNVLSKMVGNRVANFGVGGHGTDQAYLRFKHKTKDPAKTVILTIFPDNLKRNVNQQRYFLSPSSQGTFGLKPRFILTGDSLELQNLPEMSYSEFLASFDEPGRLFSHEYFAPGSRDGPIVWSFPFTAAIARTMGFPQVRSWLSGKPGWYGFAQKGHPSRSLTIAVLIGREFASLARKRNKRAMVLILPSQTSYNYYVDTGNPATKQLTDELKRVGVEAHDLTYGMRQYLDERSYSELQLPPGATDSHLNAEGNRVIAELVYQLIFGQRVNHSVAPPQAK